MKAKVLGVALGLTWGTLNAEAQARPLSCEPAERYQLDNGLEVVLQEDHNLPLVAVAASVEVGSRHDPKGYAGLAHYVEHLLFRGASPETGTMRRYQDVGATAINAHTTSDLTEYFAVVPSEQVERALWLEARRFAIGLSELSEEQANSEAEVVRREFALRARASWRAASGAAARGRFTAAHPYHDLQASEETLEALNLPHARWFHEQMYSMKRTRLVLVGDFDSANVRELISKYWSKLRSEAPQPSAQAAEREDLVHSLTPFRQACAFRTKGFKETSPRQLKVRVPYKAPSFTLQWQVPVGQDPEETLRVLQFWAADVSELARAKGLVVDSGAHVQEQLLANMVALGFTVTEGKDWHDILKIIVDEYESFAGKSVKSSEWRSVSQSLELDHALSSPNFLNRALALTTRHCSPIACKASDKLTQQKVLETMKSLDPRQAMIVTSEFNFGTVRSGPTVEVVN